MKKILAFVLTLSLAIAMFSGITAFASDGLTITAGIGDTSVTVDAEAETFGSSIQVSFQLFINGNLADFYQFQSNPDGSLSVTRPIGMGLPALADGDVVRVQMNSISATYTVKPDEPEIPDVPKGTDTVNGNTGIEITADPPTLIDPADPYVATIFDAGYIGGSDLWFGTHLASSEPQELPSIDNGEGKGSIISLVTYNQHKVNGIYGIKGQIGIFARNDEAKTPVIEDFLLSLEATTTKWCKDDDSTFVPKFTAHNITSGFVMGPNEDPLKLFDTDTVGYMLSDYKGVLTLPADAVLATGSATAVMTWTIEAEVI